MSDLNMPAATCTFCCRLEAQALMTIGAKIEALKDFIN